MLPEPPESYELSEDDPYALLAGRVRAKTEVILDLDEVTALIESFGITDRMALQDYEEPNVAALAERVKPLIYEEDTPETPEEESLEDPAPYSYENLFTASYVKIRRSRFWHWSHNLWRRYVNSFFFAMPMIVSIIGLLVLRASLWASLTYDVPMATAIGFGTLASLIVTGGYGQAIGRRGLFYLVQEEHSHARSICYYFIGVGFEVSLAFGCLMFAFNLIFNVLPMKLALISLTYYMFLSLLWLFLSVLYMLGQPFMFTTIIVIGIIVVWALQRYVGGIVFRQSASLGLAGVLSFLGGYAIFGRKGYRRITVVWSSVLACLAMVVTFWVCRGIQQIYVIGICIVALLALFLVSYDFARRQAREEAETRTAELPRSSLLWYKVGGYFTYGMLYFLFLLVDRVIAWSTMDHAALQGAFTFRTNYEVGMDWGLIILFCTLGLAESAIILFSESIRETEARYSLEETERLADVYQRFYIIRAILFLILSVFVSIVLWFGVTYYAQHSTSKILKSYLDPTTRMVFLIAVPGYIMLSWSLFNNVFLFALSRPERVIYNILVALATHIIVSFILTRLFGHQYAAVGFCIGSFVLGVMSTMTVLNVISDIGYYYYSAYL
jgi:hypothetical protein